MSSLHQLKADNTRLEERLASLTNRKNQLLQVNARLATPMSCTSTSLTVTPCVASQSTPASSRASTASSQGSLSTETKTTQSLEGPRGTIKAGADGAPKLEVSQSADGGKVPLVSDGKAPISANVKPGNIAGGNHQCLVNAPKWNIYVVVWFYPWFNFYFPLFLGMVMYDKTKGIKN